MPSPTKRALLTITTLWVGIALWVGTSAPGAADSSTVPVEIKEPNLAGSWYPGSAQELKAQVASFLDRASPARIPGQVAALIVPHAGYMFSGQVAAYAFKTALDQPFTTVVVIAPSHHARFPGVSVYDRGGLRTPLGVMELDRDLVARLESSEPRVRYVPEAFAREHSLEIQVPFLQVVLPKAKLVPLIMGDQGLDTCRWLASAIAQAVRGQRILLVASSDLSHFHTDEEARKLDRVVIERIEQFDADGLARSLAARECEACGAGPMITTLLAARELGADRAKVLHYANSGDVTGDRGRVVGYLAAAVYAQAGNAAQPKPGPERAEQAGPSLSAEDKAILHRIARQHIEARCRAQAPPSLPRCSKALQQHRGAFVTLKRRGQLRGCIGHIVGDQPLPETVADMAVAAAFQDSRFPSLREEELEDLEIEISVLTPLQQVSDPEAIQVGVHGIFLMQGRHTGLLLPQVATERGWDRTTFLEQTCRKANLPNGAWRDPDTKIYIFAAEVF